MHAQQKPRGHRRRSVYCEACAVGTKTVAMRSGAKPGKRIGLDKGTEPRRSRKGIGYGEGPTQAWEDWAIDWLV